ncbi:hypothetical protein HNY73_000771 [Argiope bruennichi]|uniref:Uncharacterized protein n=1 Tax=Argiope bruennichi TaxID=94029 RepID=A0A8T0FZC3_ARGBR|nr:hypothetical protein HNY73_000771 [Argiope bruennichi]
MENLTKIEFSEQIRMNITTENLPSNFENEIVENYETISIRCNLKSMDDINEWVKEFGNSTNTKWNVRKSCPSGKRFVCWKNFVCQHSSFIKVPAINNKKGISKNAECPASIMVKIKLNTTRMRKEDDFLRRGLTGIVTIIPFHKHSLTSAEILRFLPAEDCREQFEDYFGDGMRPAEAAKYHKGILEMKSDFQLSDLANSRINPLLRTIEYWYEKWRLLHLGSRNGPNMIEEG